MALAVRSALKDAGVAAGDIDHINAHGTSTPASMLRARQGGRRRSPRRWPTSPSPEAGFLTGALPVDGGLGMGT